MGLLNHDKFIRQVAIILNNDYGENAKHEVVKRIVVLVKQSLHTDAVGIRLKEGNDFPYYSTIGFTDTFVVAEQSLCRLDANGQPICDKDGKPTLACTCGALLSGNLDKNFSGFTGTSLCSNNTDAMLKNMPTNNLPLGFRGRCHQDGYQSVLLVRIENGDTAVGLLQCNSIQANAFSEDDVSTLEDACSMIGKAIEPILELESKKKKEIRSMIVRLDDSIDELERIIENLPTIDKND